MPLAPPNEQAIAELMASYVTNWGPPKDQADYEARLQQAIGQAGGQADAQYHLSGQANRDASRAPQWDDKGPFMISQTGQKQYIPPISAAQYRDDPRMIEWAKQQGVFIDEQGQVQNTAAPGGSLFKERGHWNPDTGQFDQDINWGNIASMGVGGMIAGPAIAGALAGAGGGAAGGGALASSVPVAGTVGMTAAPAAIGSAGASAGLGGGLLASSVPVAGGVGMGAAPAALGAGGAGGAAPLLSSSNPLAGYGSGMGGAPNIAGQATNTAGLLGGGTTSGGIWDTVLGSMGGIPGLINTGTNIAGGLMGADAANDAARIQAESADKALALQKQIYEQTRGDLTPYRDAGAQGLAGLQGQQPFAPPPGLSLQDLQRGYQAPGAQAQPYGGAQQYSPQSGEAVSGGIRDASGQPIDGGGLYNTNGGEAVSGGFQQASQGTGYAPTDLSLQSLASQRYQAPAGLSTAELAAQKYQAPQGLSTAELAAQKYQAPQGLALDQLAAERFTAPTAEQAQATPGFQFSLDKAQKALQQSAAAKGTLLSSATAQRLQENAIGLADQNYGNVYGRAYQNFSEQQARNMGLAGQDYSRYADTQNRNIGLAGQDYSQYADQMNRNVGLAGQDYARFGDTRANNLGLYDRAYQGYRGDEARNFNLADLGYRAATGQAAAGTNYAAGAGDLLTQQANANAAGRIGSTNAWTGALGGIANNLTLQQMLQRGY